MSIKYIHLIFKLNVMKNIKKVVIGLAIIAASSFAIYQFVPKATAHDCATCSATGTCNA